eukprot:5329414-Karenia_brevis.AAC.1
MMIGEAIAEQVEGLFGRRKGSHRIVLQNERGEISANDKIRQHFDWKGRIIYTWVAERPKTKNEKACEGIICTAGG